MSGILWADWFGRGHPDKVVPFMTRIYLAVTDKQDSRKVQPTDTGAHGRKITTLCVRQVKKMRPRYRSTYRSIGPTVNGDITHYRCANFELQSIQKHESSVHVILVYESNTEPTPSYLWIAYPLTTLSTLAELLWNKQGNSRPVKDKRLFDYGGILLNCGWSCLVAQRAWAKGLHSLIRRDCSKRGEQHPCVWQPAEQSLLLFAIWNAACTFRWV